MLVNGRLGPKLVGGFGATARVCAFVGDRARTVDVMIYKMLAATKSYATVQGVLGDLVSETRVLQVNAAIEQMNDVTQSMAANSEESAASAEELTGQADSMQGMVERFTLGNATVPSALSNRRGAATAASRRPVNARSRRPLSAAAQIPFDREEAGVGFTADDTSIFGSF